MFICWPLTSAIIKSALHRADPSQNCDVNEVGLWSSTFIFIWGLNVLVPNYHTQGFDATKVLSSSSQLELLTTLEAVLPLLSSPCIQQTHWYFSLVLAEIFWPGKSPESLHLKLLSDWVYPMSSLHNWFFLLPDQDLTLFFIQLCCLNPSLVRVLLNLSLVLRYFSYFLYLYALCCFNLHGFCDLIQNCLWEIMKNKALHGILRNTMSIFNIIFGFGISAC